MTITSWIWIAVIAMTLVTVGIVAMALNNKEYSVIAYAVVSYVVIMAVVYLLVEVDIFGGLFS